MAKVKLNADGRLVSLTAKGRERPLRAGVDWGRVDATGEREITRQIAEDDAEAARDAAAFARRVRGRTKLSQPEFAQRIGVPVETVRNWEQGKRSPRGPARALLRVIDKAPYLAFAALDDDLARYPEVLYSSNQLIAERRAENVKEEEEAIRARHDATKKRRQS